VTRLVPTKKPSTSEHYKRWLQERRRTHAVDARPPTETWQFMRMLLEIKDLILDGIFGNVLQDISLIEIASKTPSCKEIAVPARSLVTALRQAPGDVVSASAAATADVGTNAHASIRTRYNCASKRIGIFWSSFNVIDETVTDAEVHSFDKCAETQLGDAKYLLLYRAVSKERCCEQQKFAEYEHGFVAGGANRASML
jgi:hypothetical protein